LCSVDDKKVLLCYVVFLRNTVLMQEVWWGNDIKNVTLVVSEASVVRI
jgi:hypothetical protein